MIYTATHTGTVS